MAPFTGCWLSNLVVRMGGDLNPHDLGPQPLKLTRLPIPPHPRNTKWVKSLLRGIYMMRTKTQKMQ